MNKLFILCGLVMLGTTTTPQEQITTSNSADQGAYISTVIKEGNRTIVLADDTPTLWAAPRLVSRVNIHTPHAPEELNLAEIAFIEEESTIDLGFDTADYLPENFDPYTVYFNLNGVEYIEEEESVDLNFEVKDYLPTDFNPYANPTDIQAITFIEEEDEIDLGFDTKKYLPEGFDPYISTFDLNEVEYIEEEEELDFNFDFEDYLPEGFNPYSK